MHERSICWEAISHLLPQYACGARIEGKDRGRRGIGERERDREEKGYCDRRWERGEVWQKKGGRKRNKIVFSNGLKGQCHEVFFYRRFMYFMQNPQTTSPFSKVSCSQGPHPPSYSQALSYCSFA
jgi:hypothetical protein